MEVVILVAAGMLVLGGVLWLFFSRKDPLYRVVRLLEEDTKDATRAPALLVQALFVRRGYFDRARVPKKGRLSLATRVLAHFGFADKANEDWVVDHLPVGIFASVGRGARWIFDEVGDGLRDPDRRVRLHTVIAVVLVATFLSGILGFFVPLLQVFTKSPPSPVLTSSSSGGPVLYTPTATPAGLPTVTPTTPPVRQLVPRGRQVGQVGGIPLTVEDTKNIPLHLNSLISVVFGGEFHGQEIDGAVAVWVTYIDAPATPENQDRYQQAMSWYLGQCRDDGSPTSVTYFEYFHRLAEDYDLASVQGATEAVRQALDLCQVVQLLAKMYPPPVGDDQVDIWREWVGNKHLAERVSADGDGRFKVDILLTEGPLATFPNRSWVLGQAGLNPGVQNPLLEKVWEVSGALKITPVPTVMSLQEGG